MPIFLPTPAHRPAGPDGQGWNRLTVFSMAGDECALRPRSYATLYMSQDTRRASYGGFGPCTRGGDCGTCPILNAPQRRTLNTTADQVVVRVRTAETSTGQVYARPVVMTTDEGEPWSWQELARLDGWTLGRQFRDADGEGFWLYRAGPAPLVPGMAVEYHGRYLNGHGKYVIVAVENNARYHIRDLEYPDLELRYVGRENLTLLTAALRP